MINSRLGRFAATPAGSESELRHLQGHSFSRSYGVSMPSSLTMVLPIASVCSTRPPVSVLVRAPCACLGVFPGSMDSAASPIRFVSRLGHVRRWFPCDAPYALSRGRPEPRPPILLRHPIVVTATRWYGNIDPLCIGYACRPRLSSRLTLGGLAFPRNPWAYGGGVSRPSLVTHASILTSEQSTEGCPVCFAPLGKLPYH